MTVPVVGTLLMFSLMIGAPAAARSLTDRPGVAMAFSAAIALAVVWAAIALSYETDWPVGFFVGTGSAVVFVFARLWGAGRERFAGRRPSGARPRRA
jgi:zinc/manganese transport system permease protein